MTYIYLLACLPVDVTEQGSNISLFKPAHLFQYLPYMHVQPQCARLKLHACISYFHIIMIILFNSWFDKD